ncbi:MAG: hypothetical protein HUU15_10285, partial [Candidatus Brocadiae bacterium]|nr:hypothetical protein [Candidatus Brocadiia bacterium]
MSGAGREAGLRVGVALGTWRIAIAASNGSREHFGSLAGWPKSAAARRLICRDSVFGTEAYRLRAALNLSRPFEAGRLAGAEGRRAASALIAQA